MATKKYQVFVSSTFRDLVDERQDTIRNILDLNHIPAGMELFPAADVEQLTYIKKVIDECDYYLLIVGGRYGSMDAEGVSFTEREYDYAVETGKFVIAFVHGEPGAISVRNSDVKPEVAEALNKFRDKVMSGRLAREWTNRQTLEVAVIKSLTHAFSAFPQTGWIRGDAAANEMVLEQSNKALRENAELRARILELEADQPAQYSNLADLNDRIEIRYRITHWAGTYYTYPERKVVMTWGQIFIHLAAILSTSQTDAAIPMALKEALREAGQTTEFYDMNSTDRAKIKVQLTALGLISTGVTQTTKGGVAEFLSLTPKGKSTFISGMVVRKADTD